MDRHRADQSLLNVQICVWEHAPHHALALMFTALSNCPSSTPSLQGTLKWQCSAVLKTHLKTWVSSQYSSPYFGLSLVGHMPVFQEHVLINHIISKGLCGQLPQTTTLPKDRGAELLHLLPTYQNWFYREADFYFSLFLKRRLMKSTRTDTTFLSASWASLTRNYNEISQHSKGLSDEKFIPKPMRKGKKFGRFISDLVLALGRRCWSPGLAALLCLWLSRWHNTDDSGCKWIDNPL